MLHFQEAPPDWRGISLIKCTEDSRPHRDDPSERMSDLQRTRVAEANYQWLVETGRISTQAGEKFGTLNSTIEHNYYRYAATLQWYNRYWITWRA